MPNDEAQSAGVGGKDRNAGAPPSIPDHELLRRIGAGSYGEVWLARNVLGSYRAVKVVYRSSFDSDRPFAREFEGIQTFEPVSRTHASQVDVLQVGRREGYFYYVMELADDLRGGREFDPAAYEPKTLKARAAGEPRLPFRECLSIGLALTEALEHLHARGLVHRDIKPANIIFVGGVPKLADIGLVTTADATRTFVGTEGFLPPEGAGTPQADLYALGKVLYEISTGLDRREYPAAARDFGVLPERLQLLELEEIIEKACAPDPRERYANAGRMRADLEALAAGQSVRRRHRWERWKARGWTVMKAGAGAMAGAAVVAAWLWWRQGSSAGLGPGLSARNPEAVKAYKLGVFHVQKRTWAGYTNAAAELQRAIELDPGFFEAHAALAEAYAHQARFADVPPGPHWRRAYDSAQQALALHPDLPQALIVLAMYQRDYVRDLARAEDLCRQAMALAPSESNPPYVLSHVLSFRGRAGESVEAARRAADLDPTSGLLRANLAARLVYARRFDEAVAAYQAAIQLHPTLHVPYEELGYLFLHLRREPEALEVLSKGWQLGSLTEAAARERREALAAGGARGLWDYLVRVRTESPRTANPADTARFLIGLGRLDEAMEWAEIALRERRNVFNLLEHPYYEGLHAHPRFAEFARRVRQPEP